MIGLLFACCFPLTSLLATDVTSRVDGHLLIGDFRAAEKEAEAAREKFPDSLLKAYAAGGREQKLLRLASEMGELSDEQLEIVAWGVIRAGSQSGSLPVQFYAAIGAQMGQDMRGVELLVGAMRSRNRDVRVAAVEIASRMRDPLLQKEVLALAQSDREWRVRMAALQAAGSMKIQQARPLLEQSLAAVNRSAEERSAALQGIINLTEEPTREQVERLVRAERAGLRLLASRLVDYFDRADLLPLLYPLLDDSNSDVRTSAWVALGWLAPTLELMREDPHPEVAIAIAWVKARSGALEDLQGWIDHPTPNLRRKAAAALCHLGESALPQVAELLDHEDVFIRLKAAETLAAHGKLLPECRRVISKTLQTQQAMMFTGEAPFARIAESDVSSRTPQRAARDQAVRLKLLNTLALLKDPEVEEALRQFLTSQQWGVPSAAAGTLLSEGSEAARDAIYALLSDPDRKLRLQGALTLASWGRDRRALSVLTEIYPEGSRWEKERILEALGHIGDKTMIPFLTRSLQEPFPQLRLIAASALIQCLRS